MSQEPNYTQLRLAYPRSVVAIDLGSNSFHLLEASHDNGLLVPLAKRGKKVQLGLGMVDNHLTAEAIKRALACVQEFAPYIQDKPDEVVRVVGTQALRQADNSAEFIRQASDILQHAIEIISGEEEAALVYWGVKTQLQSDRPLLAIDVGGGSTEMVRGCGDKVTAVGSVPVGCVSYMGYFPEGSISAARMDSAQQAAGLGFMPMVDRFAGEDRLVVGCSGTLLAVEQVLLQQGWSEQGINRAGLEQLKRALLNFDNIEAVSFQGLKEGRRSIFASGVAITLALFDTFGISQMQLSSCALREGISWQLLQSRR